MKLHTFVFFLLLIMSSCNFDKEPFGSFQPEQIKLNYFTTDTNDVKKNEFKSMEEFKVTFEVINNSYKNLNYYSSLPVISFSVLRDDSVIAKSTDHMAYVAIMLEGQLDNGTSLKDQWIGPNTLGRKDVDELIVLEPGNYQIYVEHRALFSEYGLPDTEPIHIVIKTP